MARKKKTADLEARQKGPVLGEDVEIADAGVVMETEITDTLEQNYMPYAMSVIVSRALPDIDGFKPSHRKILYTMYEMGLLRGARTKSANIVGTTMRLNPHGDQAIYETMVRLARGNEALLVPFVDSKGNFGKFYSRDMSHAAARYTEAKLEAVCEELFRDIDKDTVDFVDNYDSTRKEPVRLPVSFPTILTNTTLGIAVGMASSICSFNLTEICETTSALMDDAAHDLFSTLKGPDFIGGGTYLYDEEQLRNVCDEGRGSLRVRAKYRYDKENHMLEITEIPPTTTVEAVMDKVSDLVKDGRIKELSDMRDETDLSGLKLTFDLKRGVDPEKFMEKLYRLTALEDSFPCNFNVLISGSPRVVGVRDLLLEWIAFRIVAVRRRTQFELGEKRARLHLLRGLEAILLDIDKAVRIIRHTDEEAEVIPNLMIGFGIDKTQAEYVAEIRLRQLNREYILKRTAEIKDLERDTAELHTIVNSKPKIRRLIQAELKEVAAKYGKPRRTDILYEHAAAAEEESDEQDVPNHPVHIFFTKEGYFKKIIPQSLRMSADQRLKEGDSILFTAEVPSSAHLLVFTDKAQVYKTRVFEFEDTKASAMGDYLPAKLGMDTEERAIFAAYTTNYSEKLFFVFENGKVAKIPLNAYETVTNRKKLVNAFSDKSPVVRVFQMGDDMEIGLESSAGKLLLFNTAQVSLKSTKSAAGVSAMTLKKGQKITEAHTGVRYNLSSPGRYRARNLPAAGAVYREEDRAEQTSFGEEA